MGNKLKICPAEGVDLGSVQFFDGSVQAGFPSPAEDHMDLDLDKFTRVRVIQWLVPAYKVAMLESLL